MFFLHDESWSEGLNLDQCECEPLHNVEKSVARCNLQDSLLTRKASSFLIGEAVFTLPKVVIIRMSAAASMTLLRQNSHTAQLMVASSSSLTGFLYRLFDRCWLSPSSDGAVEKMCGGIRTCCLSDKICCGESPYNNVVRRFDLTLELTVMRGGKSVEGHLEYNEDLFARETAVRLITSLQVFQFLLGLVCQLSSSSRYPERHGNAWMKSSLCNVECFCFTLKPAHA